MSTLSQFFSSGGAGEESSTSIVKYLFSSENVTIPADATYAAYGVIGAGGSFHGSGAGFSYSESDLSATNSDINVTATVGAPNLYGFDCLDADINNLCSGSSIISGFSNGTICAEGGKSWFNCCFNQSLWDNVVRTPACGSGGLINTCGGIAGITEDEFCCYLYHPEASDDDPFCYCCCKNYRGGGGAGGPLGNGGVGAWLYSDDDPYCWEGPGRGGNYGSGSGLSKNFDCNSTNDCLESIVNLSCIDGIPSDVPAGCQSRRETQDGTPGLLGAKRGSCIGPEDPEIAFLNSYTETYRFSQAKTFLTPISGGMSDNSTFAPPGVAAGPNSRTVNSGFGAGASGCSCKGSFCGAGIGGGGETTGGNGFAIIEYWKD